MKKTFSLILALLMIVFTLCACQPNQSDKLVIYNWADYIYDTDLEDFADYYFEQTGRTVDITYVTFDTNETMLTKIQQGDADVDVICPSEYAIQKLIVPLGFHVLGLSASHYNIIQPKIRPQKES